jgi:hypothetical protein
MNTDVIGRVRNTPLAAGAGLMPTFEAIVNSVQAMDGLVPGTITVRIDRAQGTLNLPDIHGNTIADISDFIIIDDGRGFSTANFRSFETMDSREKAAMGGKGIGRLLWLKAFESAEIDSVFEENGKWYRRTFRFTLTDSGIEDHELVELPMPRKKAETKVRLSGFRKQYRDGSPKSAEAIGRRIVEQCLGMYAIAAMPVVIVDDPSEKTKINLSDVYKKDYETLSQKRTFEIEGQAFTITDILLHTADPDHRLHFCAHRRVVRSRLLRDVLPHTDRPFLTAGDTPVVYFGCVTGPYLDEHVDAERTSFDIADEGSLWATGSLTWQKIEQAAIRSAGEFLEPKTKDAEDAAMDRIRKFIEQNPKYRPLLGHRSHQLSRLSASLTDERLDAELHKLASSWRQEVRERVSRALADLPVESESFAEHHSKFVELLGELEEQQKSDLADYVVGRASILRFFEGLLKKTESGKFEKEDALHELFFPQRTTSDEVDFDKHNLWLLDERQAFHQYLASDLRFSQQDGAPTQVDGDDRADILIYNRAMSFTQGENPASVVVVEFKRPERDDYSDEDNPIRQVLDYVGQVREGRARRPDGGSIDPLPPDTPFYCHVVATLTPKLRAEALQRGFFETPDRRGFFHFNQNLRAYIEVSGYRKVLEDAKKRNQAFFEKLQINVSAR